MIDLLIWGTSAHAFEMVKIIERVNDNARIPDRFNLIGFIDHQDSVNEVCRLPVFTPDELDEKLQHVNLLPIHSVPLALKRKYLSRMVSLIDPSCFISESARIGSGCVLYPYCFVGHQVIINDFVFCLSGCRINHNVSLGRSSTLASDVVLAGHVIVGQEVYLGQACSIRGNLEIGERSLLVQVLLC